MMYDDRIVLKIDGHTLLNQAFLGWQYYKPYGQPSISKMGRSPYYYHTDWHDLVEKALDGLKDSLGEEYIPSPFPLFTLHFSVRG